MIEKCLEMGTFFVAFLLNRLRKHPLNRVYKFSKMLKFNCEKRQK